MSTASLAQAPSRLINRRSALRLAFAAVPAVAGLAFAGAASAGTTTQTIQTAGGPVSIELVDAVSRTVAGDAATERAALAPGTYRPSATTTGPIAGTKLTRVDGDFVATANGQVIQNLEVFGRINLKSFSNVKVRNCVVWGTLATGGETAFVFFAGDDGRGALIEDCRFTGRNNVWMHGMRGGNYTIRRTEISGVIDGLSFTSAIGNVTAEGCWIHNGLYKEWSATTTGMPKQGSNYTHNDGVQFHRGKNYTLRGNFIGGSRVPGDHHSGMEAQLAGADDWYNSALMIKQEVDSTTASRIENVLIESNWIAGSAASINLTSGNGNTFATTVIRNNRFIRSTWGTQIYILSGAGLGQLSGNVFDDNGAPVPVSKGY